MAGQRVARRALEVAAAGAHHLFLSGAPGAGKTMLAERLPGILPMLDDEHALEVTAVHSVAGALAQDGCLVRVPPFQAPHHTASMAALVGGGPGLARAGSISLAHRGVLFLDEAPEFQPAALDALRQPLESGYVVLQRSAGSVTYPARFLLVLAANPCACGAPRDRDCTCASGRPPALPAAAVRPTARSDRSARGRRAGGPRRPDGRHVDAGVERRGGGAGGRRPRGWPPPAGGRTGGRRNADAHGALLRARPWRPARAALDTVERAMDQGLLSARGYDRVLRIAWTIADLAGHESPDIGDVAEALYYRTGRSMAAA